MTDETKLPKWAQNSLAVLRADVARLEAACATLKREAANRGATGKVVIDEYPMRIPLGDRSVIRFGLPHQGAISCMLRDGGSILDINSVGTLQIYPKAANSVWLKVER